jgi:hypothetical protein
MLSKNVNGLFYEFFWAKNGKITNPKNTKNQFYKVKFSVSWIWISFGAPFVFSLFGKVDF